MHRKLPARLALLTALLAAPSLFAQMHKVAPPQTVTRAIGVYEFTGPLEKPTASRLVPISLFINGRLEDAGIYRPQPMPFALQTGNIYLLEQAGKPIGTVTLDYARNLLPAGASPDIASVGTWFGYGTFAPPEVPKPSTLTASVKIAPIDGESTNSDDDRPHFAGKQPGDGNATPPATPPTASSKTPATPANPAPPEDPDRPHLNRRTTPPPTSPDPDANDPDRPTLKHRDLPPDESSSKKSKYSDSSVIPMATSLNDDPDRPTLQRGKVSGVISTTALVGLPTNLDQLVAVSDATDREPHIFLRPWGTHTEHTDVQKRLAALAAPLVAQYEARNNLTAVAPAATTHRPTLRLKTTSPEKKSPHTTATTSAPPALFDDSVAGYELSYGGLPTFVYTAHSPITVGGPVYVTLIAQRLPSGDLQLSLTSVTDAAHLDRTPRMHFVDAVDPDASNRASLLFELRAQHTREFALYRLITAHAEQQFVTGPIQ